jgi:hypothetical protein
VPQTAMNGLMASSGRNLTFSLARHCPERGGLGSLGVLTFRLVRDSARNELP